MDKKDIYEHLAKIYLDASSKRKKKHKKYPKVFRNLFFISIGCIVLLSVFLLIRFNRGKALNSEIALLLQSDAVKINFHFDPAKKEIYSLDLKNLNLVRFKALGFAVKKTNLQDDVYLRVEFTNIFQEKSEVYFKDIPARWQDYKVNLAEFKNISDWSSISTLSFTIEEWNAKAKNDVVYIDNVRLLR